MSAIIIKIEKITKLTNIVIFYSWAPFKPFHERDNLTLLRSCFVNKKCRVQYEVRTYYRYMNFHRLTGSTADTFLEYLERNLPEGVAMKITKVSFYSTVGYSPLMNLRYTSVPAKRDSYKISLCQCNSCKSTKTRQDLILNKHFPFSFVILQKGNRPNRCNSSSPTQFSFL